MIKKEKIYLILHNVRSAYNVGSIFRTADGAGVKKIFLTGHTPAPGVGRPYQTKAEKMLSKTALGAEEYILWEKKEDIFDLLGDFKKKKVEIVALEQSDKSKFYNEEKFDFPMALILGNEPSGIEEAVLEKCDRIIEIPMQGKKKSLNVSVATGIALYGIINK